MLNIRKLALAGLGGLALTGAVATSALADYAYTQCDRDGDHCWRVRCDNDGDFCRRTSYSYYNDYGYRAYHTGYSYRHWVCDADGDRCHWSYYGHPGVSFGFGWHD